ncbi:NAD(P)/FAD-dependent oxidoreductase [Parvularcula sp. IMCC14364]|uniref:NAD(P)/FAD-dependent oxidoreductase n=1 Tax=Parvularcula sp. IMCC14364 TaxID=3067902 RepID=UPI00274206EC|nr:FAD-dependent oxidoreductase [Parvularcula sp. IMCC14364]
MKRGQTAIIGAGVAGLACARRLQDAGWPVTVFEKSRGLGGRLATRRTPQGLTFDHGAPFIRVTEKAPDLERQLTGTGDAVIWPTATEHQYVGVPSMNAWLKPMAEGIPLRLHTRVIGIAATHDQWQLTLEADNAAATSETFDTIICTVPAPQAQELTGHLAGFSGVFDRIRMTPCWTLMVAFEERLNLPFDFQEHPDTGIAKLIRNTAKPGRPQDHDCWVVQADAAWSTDNLELEKEEAAARLLAKFADVAGIPLPAVTYQTAHRWRYALTASAYGVPFLPHPDGSLYLGGDWLLEDTVSDGWRSGNAIADALLQTD